MAPHPKHPCVEWLRSYMQARPGADFELPPPIAQKLEQEFVVEKSGAVRQLLLVQLVELAEEVHQRGLAKLAVQLARVSHGFAEKQLVVVKRDARQAKIQATAETLRRARALIAADVPATCSQDQTTKTTSEGEPLSRLVTRMIRG